MSSWVEHDIYFIISCDHGDKLQLWIYISPNNYIRCLNINKNDFLATQITKCGYLAKIRKWGWRMKWLPIQLSFSYTQTGSW